jgi:hypothetical protein
MHQVNFNELPWVDLLWPDFFPVSGGKTLTREVRSMHAQGGAPLKQLQRNENADVFTA